MWICNSIAYLVSLVLTIVKYDELNPLVFLGPDLRILNDLGCLNPYEVKENFQVWRLFTTLFLSLGFSNYCISSMLLMFVGFMIESSRMGIWRICLFYFACGGVSSIFSCLINSELSCGNFSAIMALVSGLLALVIRNWKPLNGAGQGGMLRVCLIFIIVMIFIVVLMLTASAASPGRDFNGTDLGGEGGGFMAGLWLGMVMMPAVRHSANDRGSYERFVQKIGGGISIFYFLLLIILFIFVANPAQTYYS